MTWRLAGVDESQLYSGPQLDVLLAGLSCPGCGAPVTVDRIPVVGSTGFLAGHWRCTADAGHTSAARGRQ